MGPLIESEKQLIIRMKDSGNTLKDIADVTHRSTITIRKFLLSQGYPLTNPWFTAEERDNIKRLFESGHSCSEISRLTGKSKNGINNFLSRLGYDTSLDLITDDEKALAIKVFQETHNCAKAAQAIGRSRDGTWRMLKREGYDTQRNIYNWLSEEQISMIRTMYSSGYTAKEILPYLNGTIVSENSIIEVARDGGIDIRSKGYRNIILNEDFFDNIDTEEKAYIIGFLLADGYVIEQRKRSDSWGITLQAQDRYMIEKIRELVGSDNKIIYSRGEYVFLVYSQHMVDMLARYNIIPRKCKTASFPSETISYDLWKYIIRGLFDGDGCISGQKCSFYGNNILIPQLQSILHNAIGINLTKLFNSNGVWRFTFSSQKDVCAFYHYIYDEATIFLTRKRQRFEQLSFILQ